MLNCFLWTTIVMFLLYFFSLHSSLRKQFLNFLFLYIILLIKKKNQICAILSWNQSLNNVPFKFIEISSNRSSRSQSRDLRGSESSIDLLGHLSSWSTLKRECQRLFTAILAEFEFPLLVLSSTCTRLDCECAPNTSNFVFNCSCGAVKWNDFAI